MTPRRDPVECPHCGEPTQPNALADGSVVCSCAAEREITESARQALRRDAHPPPSGREPAGPPSHGAASGRMKTVRASRGEPRPASG